jgi:hypothetical protein
MSSSWQTVKGDEWWYKDAFVKVEASFAANILSIEALKFASSPLSTVVLHSFLWNTSIEFEGSTILLALSKEVEQALEALRVNGRVQYELITSSFSKEARVSFVLEPAPIEIPKK